MKLKSPLATIAALLVATSTYAAQTNWEATSGALPTEPFQLLNTSNVEAPFLANGALTLANNVNDENMIYLMSGNDFLFPDQLEINFTMKFGSGSSQYSYRTPAAVVFTTAAGVGNSLWIGADRLFLMLGGTTVGQSTTTVDTNDVFHEYRIVVSGKAAGSGISVFQDGVLTLTGNSVIDLSNNGSAQRVAFGEVSNYAAGSSQWRSFGANVSAVPEPATYLLALVGCFAYSFRRHLPTAH
jgi:hypothetical protein